MARSLTRKPARRIALAVGAVAVEVVGWTLFGADEHRYPSVWLIAIVCLGTLALLAALGGLVLQENIGRIGLVVLTLVILSAVVLAFSSVYFNYGTAANFGQPLSNLDALYFAAGTLSTAGTGIFVAKTELIRAVQTVQMLLGTGLLVFLAGMIVTRLMFEHQRHG